MDKPVPPHRAGGIRKNLVPAVILGVAAALAVYAAAFQSEIFTRRTMLLFLVTLAAAVLLHAALLRWLVQPALAGFKPSTKVGLAVACLLMGLLFVTFLPVQIPALMLSPTRLEVHLDGSRNPLSGGSGATVVAFSSGDRFLSYHTFTQVGDWQRSGTDLSVSGEQPAGLSWRGRMQEGELVFRSFSAGGIVEVSWDRQVTRLDTYAPQDGQVSVVYRRDTPWTEIAFTWLCAGAAAGALYLGLLALVLLSCKGGSAARDASPLIPQASRGVRCGMAVLGLLAADIFLLATCRSGLWLETDTTSYLSASRHLTAGEGYIAMDGDTYVWWPPLYPAILAPLNAISRFGALELNRWLNALLLALTVYLSGCCARRLLGGIRGLFWPGMLLFVLARPLLVSYSSALSEPLYLLLQTLILLHVARFLEGGNPLDAVAFTLAASLCSLTRYIGAYILPVTTLLLLAATAGNLKQRFNKAAAFVLAADLPLALWLGRNWLLAGTLTGPRSASELSLWQNLASLATTIIGWYIPFPVKLVNSLALAVPAVLCILTLVVYGLTQSEGYRNFTNRVAVLFGLAYATAITAYLSILTNAAINDRILAPLHLPLTLLVLAGLQQLWLAASARRARVAQAALSLALFAMLLPAARLTWQSTKIDPMQSVTNQGFAFRSLYNSELANKLRNNPPARTVPFFSNCPRCLYVYADLHPSALLDGQAENNIYLPEKIQPFLLFWFDDVAPVQTRVKPQGLPDLSALTGTPLSIQPIEQANDGQVYLVEPIQP